MTDKKPSSAAANISKTDLDTELAHMDLWWRAANYLAVGQIYLLDNPLLREPLKIEHVKPRLWAIGEPRLASISSMSI